MTPAETLTAAADRIERVAGGATPGPYSFTRSLGHGLPCGEWSSADVIASHGDYLCSELSDADAEHIALWSPDVALLLVPILRAEAARLAKSFPCCAPMRSANPDLLALAERINNQIGDRA